MTYAPKLVLELPISNRALLKPFVERCLREHVVLVAIAGPGADEVEDMIDDILIDDGADESRFFVTSSHDDQSIEEVMAFADAWATDQPSAVELLRL
jgi:hypothetical protein